MPNEIIDVGEKPTEEQTTIAEVGPSLVSFLGGLREFFSGAVELEKKAAGMVADSKAWKEPTSKDEDAVIVEGVRKANAHKRAIEEYWWPATMLHRLHRATTKARDRGVEMSIEAAIQGTKLHNAYEAKELRRVQEEARRQREEADRKAAEDRQRELDELDRKAQEAEAATEDLSERERLYVSLRVGGSTPTNSAKMAGYARWQDAGERLERSVKIIKAIASGLTAAASRRQAEALKSAPLRPVEAAPIEKAQIATAGIRRFSAEVYDADAFLAAVLDHGQRLRLNIPSDVVEINQPRMNDYAKDAASTVARWPGVRVVEKKSIR